MTQAEIIAVGDEITSGQRLDTNSQWLAAECGLLGLPAKFHSAVGDETDAIVRVLREASERCEMVLMTGGLGPTADDLTRQALAQWSGCPLEMDNRALAHITALYQRRHRTMPESNRVQAMFPRGSRPIANPHGTAPGIEIQLPRDPRPSCTVYALPGVPAEMKQMWQHSVRDTVQRQLGQQQTIGHHLIRCFGVGESHLESMLPDLIRRGRNPAVGITVSQATITLRVTSAGTDPGACRQAMQPTIDTILDCLGPLVFAQGDLELQDVVVAALSQRSATLCTVEWATAGLLAHWLGSTRSAAQTYLGGWVVSDQHLPQPLRSELSLSDLHAPAAMTQVARLAQRQFDSDYALVVGPRQPTASQDAPPDPQVALAWSDRQTSETTTGSLAGHPDIRLARCAKQALDLLRGQLFRIRE